MLMALGNNIRFHRERLKWTLEKLSERSGVDVGTISALEIRNSGRSKYAAQICAALGFTVEQLSDETFDWEGFQAAAAWPFSLVDERKFRALSKEDRDRVETALIAIAHNLKIDLMPSNATDLKTG